MRRYINQSVSRCREPWVRREVTVRSKVRLYGTTHVNLESRYPVNTDHRENGVGGGSCRRSGDGMIARTSRCRCASCQGEPEGEQCSAHGNNYRPLAGTTVETTS